MSQRVRHYEISEVGLGLAKYDAMVLAIETCHSVDEVKAIRDKAVAIQAHAKQALNREAERHVAEIRVRAERKTGELVKEGQQNGTIKKSGGTGANKHREQTSDTQRTAKTIADLGISYDQSSQWQKHWIRARTAMHHIFMQHSSASSTSGRDWGTSHPYSLTFTEHAQAVTKFPVI